MNVEASTVAELRKRTGAGMMDCKKALMEEKGNIDRAEAYLKKKGLDTAVKRLGRPVGEGLIGSYVHAGSKLGVLVEVKCETDFVARTEDFQSFVRELAMHIAAQKPLGITRDDVPAEMIQNRKKAATIAGELDKKSGEDMEKHVEADLEQFFSEVCLVDQPYVRDTSVKVGQLLQELIAKIGENIVISRFCRMEIGA
jgi:elongation factor Ts